MGWLVQTLRALWGLAEPWIWVLLLALILGLILALAWTLLRRTLPFVLLGGAVLVIVFLVWPMITPRTYVVRRGDTFTAIARLLDLSPDQLQRQNPHIRDRGHLRAGERIRYRPRLRSLLRSAGPLPAGPPSGRSAGVGKSPNGGALSAVPGRVGDRRLCDDDRPVTSVLVRYAGPRFPCVNPRVGSEAGSAVIVNPFLSGAGLYFPEGRVERNFFVGGNPCALQARRDGCDFLVSEADPREFLSRNARFDFVGSVPFVFLAEGGS